ncbi:hypothetical protein HD553DRAFT_339827 [Filobasidium floriforme]|uniref:uncharacterized protein n=1 Tax=Filobasidium floriforme TaxID=5210 RepID=UPI001E8DC0E9|nr:uncharacterized protein HD553DRAFT_339827 [Filobasidium floriforme]KAH8088468.1 hypothetical protein HD553DRAFT_339827 [Filobasidium floriforme]
MARMEECLQLKEMDFIEHGQDPNYPGQDMAIMVLTFRKTNQMDPFDSNRYQMHEPMDENEKPVWALPRLLRWRQFVTEKTHIPHAGSHMLLPAISSGGKIDLEQAMPQRSWMAIFDRLCQDSGLNDKHPNSTVRRREGSREDRLDVYLRGHIRE